MYLVEIHERHALLLAFCVKGFFLCFCAKSSRSSFSGVRKRRVSPPKDPRPARVSARAKPTIHVWWVAYPILTEPWAGQGLGMDAWRVCVDDSSYWEVLD